MNWRERLADWISGKRLTYWQEMYGAEVGRVMKAADINKRLSADAMEWNTTAQIAEAEVEVLREEAANIAAQLDDAQKMARHWEGQYAMAKHAAKTFEADAMAFNKSLRSILTARNITEARKIARQALGEAE